MTDTPDDLLPGNATPMERALSQTAARLLDVDTDIIRTIRRAATCPVTLLPWLAFERAVDEWDPSWPESTKRAAIAASFDVHRTKGTRYALNKALATLGFTIGVQEWFTYGGRPYCFKLTVNLDGATPFGPDDGARILRVAIRAKNVRSFLERVTLARPPTQSLIRIGAGLAVRVKSRVAPAPLTQITIPPARLRLGAWLRVRQRVRFA